MRRLSRTIVTAVSAAALAAAIPAVLAAAPAQAADDGFQATADTWFDAAAGLGTAGSLWIPTQAYGMKLRGPIDIGAFGLQFAGGEVTAGETTAAGQYGTARRGFDLMEKWANTAWAADPAPDIRSAPVATVKIKLGEPAQKTTVKVTVAANCYPYDPKHPKPVPATFRCTRADVQKFGGTLTMTARPASTMTEPGRTTIVIDSAGMTYDELLGVARGLRQVSGFEEAASAQAKYVCQAMIDRKMTQAQASAYALDNGFTTRIGSIDGVGQAVTMDYSPSRMTLSLVGGVVTACPAG